MPDVVVFYIRLIGESYGSMGMTMRWIDDITVKRKARVMRI